MTDLHNVVLLTFRDSAACHPAFEEAQQLPGLRQAAVLERGADGLLEPRDGFTRGAGVATVGSGLVGGLVGMLGGPIGALLGFAAGAALGNAAEEGRATTTGAGLIMLSPRVPAGAALLVLELREASPAPADELAARYGATVERIGADAFDEQVRAAERRAEEDGEDRNTGEDREDAGASEAPGTPGEPGAADR
ncbi:MULTISPECIES: histidine kinase [unclassified Kitasatospora]|uniref:histidine kinase n=1 Tax=unclassified Kitasatospora TaxID=2633591 RepID=UPI0037FCC054